MEPYYVIMRLPGERQAEFALIMPFKTQNGTTLPGWLAARCDGPNYGQLRQYRFPTSSQVDNPEQVDNAIQSDPEVSPKVSLLNQQGSGVLYGNLLVLPVGSSLLYVKPLYVLGTGGQGRSQQGIPKLTYVIVAEKRGTALKVVMRSTLRQALSELIGAGGAEIAAPPTGAPAVTPPSVPGGATPAVAATVPALAAEAESAFVAAEQAQRAGNWAEYGRQLERARSAIRRLREAAGAGGGTP
jgi:hypothetical protein